MVNKFLNTRNSSNLICRLEMPPVMASTQIELQHTVEYCNVDKFDDACNNNRGDYSMGCW